MEVKQINAADTYNIRNKILRPGLDIETCHFDDDNRDQTFHLGAFKDGKLVSVASFYFNKEDSLSEENQYQLRGMATLEGFRKQGLSKELLNVAFPMIKKNFCNLVWCNARVGARGFYETVGFESIGDVFEIEGVGPHILMYKKL